MNTATRRCILILLLVVLALPFAACDRAAPPPPKPSLVTTSLTSSKNLWATLPIIARDQGFFNQQGIDVKIEYVQAAKFAMDALVAGSSDFSTVVEVNLAFLAFSGNEDVSVIATIVQAYDGAIVARKDAGIAVPADLKNKRLGILQGTTSQFYAERLLAKHGLTFKDVDIQNLQPIAMQSAIVEKAIDAGSLWQPFTHNVSNAVKGEVAVFADREVYTGYMNIAVRKDWANANSTTVNGFLRALKRAKQFVADHPDQAQAIMAREINFDLETVKAIWNQYDFTLQLDHQRLVSVIADEAKWIHETQEAFKTKPVPEFSKYIEPRYLQDVVKHE